MNLNKLILTNNACYKSGEKIKVSGIMVHSTGSNNPDLKRYVGPDDGKLGKNKYGNTWNQSGVNVCVHAFIGRLESGEIATYQTLPWNHRAWHAGGSANDTHIGFEICEDGLKDREYFNAVYKEATELCAYLCKIYKLNPMKDIICHSEGAEKGIASNHADVMHWFPRHGKSMDTFRKDVKNLMEKSDTPSVTEMDTFLIQITASALNIRKGPSIDNSIVGVIQDKKKYTIVKVSNGWGLLKSYAKNQNGWINLKYTKRV